MEVTTITTKKVVFSSPGGEPAAPGCGGHDRRDAAFGRITAEQRRLSPDDGYVNLNAGRAVALHPGTQVEEAGEQQVEGWHQPGQEEQIVVLKTAF